MIVIEFIEEEDAMTEGRKILRGAITEPCPRVFRGRFPAARRSSTAEMRLPRVGRVTGPGLGLVRFHRSGLPLCRCSSVPNRVEETVRGSPLARLPARQSCDRNIAVEGCVVQLSP
jgi:hypothetical protein